METLKRDGLVYKIGFIMLVLIPTALAVVLKSCLQEEQPAIAHQEEPVFSLYDDFKADAIAAEGKRSVVYVDTLGHLTAGIGHKLDGADLADYSEGDIVSEDVVELWWAQDFRRAMQACEKHFPKFDDFPHIVKLALLNFCFQLGADAPLKFPRATALINQRRWLDAADEWLYADPRTRRWSAWRIETPHRCEQESGRLQTAAHRGLL